MSLSLLNSRPLLIASHNKGKVKEFRDLLGPLGVTIVSSAELNLPEPEETGGTFRENAAIKARQAAELSKMPALADDSGLVVPALIGAPGIYSARWAGPEKDFGVAIARVQDELAKINMQDKKVAAAFVCALALHIPEQKTHFFTGEVLGTLTFPARGAKGFGYDPIFVPGNEKRTFAEMEPEEKHRISHRADAFTQFVAFLKR